MKKKVLTFAWIFHTQNLRALINTRLQRGVKGQGRGTAVSTAFPHETKTVETVPDDKRRLHTGLKHGVQESFCARCTTISWILSTSRRFYGRTRPSVGVLVAARAAIALLLMVLLTLSSAPHCLALSGSVFAWGGGQTGLPVLTNVTAISTALDHSLALGADGSVSAWGYDFDGQSEVPAGLSQVVAISAGAFFSAALKSDGTVVAWGDNQYNQALVPADATNVTSISAGRGHVLALKTDGSVEAWGSDSYGQCDVPAGLHKVTKVLACWNYSLALHSDGTVQAWGIDDAGQTDVPAGLSSVSALAGNMEYCLALKSDGTVVAWGAAPQPPAGLTGVKAIAAGENHCLALLSDGTLAVWGADNSGQTGVPGGLAAITSLGAGWNYSLALTGGALPAVNLNLSNASWDASGVFGVLVPTQLNKSYVLQYKESMSDPSWTALPSVSGSGQSLRLTDSGPKSSHRFYRVEQY